MHVALVSIIKQALSREVLFISRIFNASIRFVLELQLFGGRSRSEIRRNTQKKQAFREKDGVLDAKRETRKTAEEFHPHSIRIGSLLLTRIINSSPSALFLFSSVIGCGNGL